MKKLTLENINLFNHSYVLFLIVDKKSSEIVLSKKEIQ